MLQPILQNTMKEVNFFLSLTESYFPDRSDLQSRLLKSTVIFSGNLKAEECFFIDDLEPNINAAKEAGMGGLVFTGDINKVKKAIGF